MPIYDYQCSDCGEVFELMVRFSETNQAQICPKCESEKTQRLLSMVASFKGSSSDSNSPGSSCASTGGFT